MSDSSQERAVRLSSAFIKVRTAVYTAFNSGRIFKSDRSKAIIRLRDTMDKAAQGRITVEAALLEFDKVFGELENLPVPVN